MLLIGLYKTKATIIAIKNDNIFIAAFTSPCLYPKNVNSATIPITIKSIK